MSRSGASARAGAPFSFARTRRPHSSARAESAPPPRMGIARPGRSLAPAPRARRPRRTRSGASRRSKTGRGRVRRLAASAPPSSKGPIGPREAAARRRRKSRRRNRGGSGFGGGGFANPGIGGLPEALDARRPLSRKGPVRRRGHRARQRGPEEGARPSAGVRRPRPAPPRARPMRPAARRRLIYEMVGMPTISLPASLGRLPRRRPKWANRGERPAPLPMRRKKRRERRSFCLVDP